MKRILIHTIALILVSSMNAQNEFHVFPMDHATNPGSVSGDGSINDPWDLQTALLKKEITDGDTLWVHGGTYNGRYISELSANNIRTKIVVSAYKEDKVVLNGNVNSSRKSVLQVKGKNVVYKNFEVTFIGEFSRNEANENFKKVDGVDHVSGVNCVFLNLKIHNNPGVGFGSWKRTGGTIIAHCRIFNNGFMGLKRGRGPGMYVQNESDDNRVIENNVIFNNYYKGVEVWSAAKKANKSYVKNVILDDNIIFNNGLPSGKFTNNILVATDDRNGINIAKNISIRRNVLYHNTNYKNNQVGGHGATLSLGNMSNVKMDKITVVDNFILGRNNALRLNDTRELIFTGNTVYAGYVHLYKSAENRMETWVSDNNKYFTKNAKPFRFISKKDLTMKQWQQEKQLDQNSSWQSIRSFDLKPILHFSKNPARPNEYVVSLFNKQGNNVQVNMQKYGMAGWNYEIVNIATDKVLQEGRIAADGIIDVTIGTFNKTAENFGVFKLIVNEPEKAKLPFFRRIFGWLF